MKVLVGLAGLAMLAACGGGDQDRGGVTAEEAARLNETEEMLDASPDSLVAEDNVELGNGELPAENIAGDNSY